MKVIGISGAQGGGKTSLLEELKTRGYEVDDFKVSRTVQQRMGFKSLDDVLSSLDLMIEFQLQVLEAKRKNDLALANSDGDDVVFVERTFADILAYTELWAGKLNGTLDHTDSACLAEFMNSYSEMCSTCQNWIYAGVAVLPLMEHVQWQHDPHRAKKEDASQVYSSVERFVLSTSPQHFVISAPDISGRADQIQTFIRNIK